MYMKSHSIKSAIILINLILFHPVSHSTTYQSDYAENSIYKGMIPPGTLILGSICCEDASLANTPIFEDGFLMLKINLKLGDRISFYDSKRHADVIAACDKKSFHTCEGLKKNGLYVFGSTVRSAKGLNVRFHCSQKDTSNKMVLDPIIVGINVMKGEISINGSKEVGKPCVDNFAEVGAEASAPEETSPTVESSPSAESSPTNVEVAPKDELNPVRQKKSTNKKPKKALPHRD